MSTRTRVEGGPGPGWRWWLPVLLVLLILLILGGAYLATHPNLFKSSPTVTPTPRFITATPKPVTATPKPGPSGTARPGPTGTARPGPSGTARPGPTGTARPGPSATPRPGPTGTPRPGPTATSASSVRTGTITYQQSQLQTIQQGANQHNPQYTIYLNPFQVVRQTLPHYGFTGGFTTVSPPQPPQQPPPTPFANAQGQPEIDFTVSYQGHKYRVVLVQPVQKGPSGIWVITQIKLIS